jgi:hypothetical protein
MGSFVSIQRPKTHIFPFADHTERETSVVSKGKHANMFASNAIHHRMAHPTGMAHFVADLPLHLNITTPQQAI